jgi:hypothetical protein
MPDFYVRMPRNLTDVERNLLTDQHLSYSYGDYEGGHVGGHRMILLPAQGETEAKDRIVTLLSLNPDDAAALDVWPAAPDQWGTEGA